MENKSKGTMVREAPLKLPQLSLMEAHAIKAFGRGEADPAQQLVAYEFIWKKLCRVPSLSINFDISAITNFNEGRRYCGITLINLVDTPIEVLLENAITLTDQEKINDSRS